jgi:anti-sigma regulatory factor (Ser/Thr protein kinase)
VEERGISIDAGLEALRRAAEDPGDPEELCDHLVASMLAIHPANDDIAVLALRGLSAEAEKLHLQVSTDPTLLGGVRREVARWLRAAGARQEEIELVQMACHEACSNAIEHGYGFGEGSFSIDAWVDAGRVILEVHDDGRWVDRGGQTLPYRGHGLPLIEKVMEAVEVSHGAGGTTVRMQCRLARDREPAPS